MLVLVEEAEADHHLAATPATWGEAMEVPEMVLVRSGAPIQAAVMPVPGAKSLQQVPNEEKVERPSVESVDITVKARGAEAGEELHALLLLLPAATTMMRPGGELPEESFDLGDFLLSCCAMVMWCDDRERQPNGTRDTIPRMEAYSWFASFHGVKNNAQAYESELEVHASG